MIAATEVVLPATCALGDCDLPASGEHFALSPYGAARGQVRLSLLNRALAPGAYETCCDEYHLCWLRASAQLSLPGR